MPYCLPLKLLSFTPCLSGHTPEAIVDHPGPLFESRDVTAVQKALCESAGQGKVVESGRVCLDNFRPVDAVKADRRTPRSQRCGLSFSRREPGHCGNRQQYRHSSLGSSSG